MRHTTYVVIVTDYRPPQVEYYDAICNNCQTHFYPLRRDALYCSNRGTEASFRKREAITHHQQTIELAQVTSKKHQLEPSGRIWL